VRDSVEQCLATMTDEAQLVALHTVAVQSTQLADFLASLRLSHRDESGAAMA